MSIRELLQKDRLTVEEVAGEATRRIDLWNLDPARREDVEAQVRREHAEALAVRTLAGVPLEDYIQAVDGDARRAAFMYATTDTLLHGTSAPDVIMDACVSIAEDWLAATAVIPCDSDEAASGKIDAILHYLETDDQVELTGAVTEMVTQLRAWRSRTVVEAA